MAGVSNNVSHTHNIIGKRNVSDILMKRYPDIHCIGREKHTAILYVESGHSGLGSIRSEDPPDVTSQEHFHPPIKEA